ncbi:peptidoglycan bridge formation glycyltransferase FemA/FemB family protein [Clostridiaceae bacterium DONG20-135]|uniref:Peptidoglycan bridge formation glycyltransferase FemA/FemB family protein n=1 Tax=Copranaerobaculum intestinale TaxID=2692629 RepID=A0A6N8U950_9FIRM|nr:peptidoglycan bridge formation glycyltransferase FemA/FemB family protein [Copranaerobaculum intestinale]MXQ73253.1 peptidoglycan bridge formation glycyltransferase FemA/FemB family protein [Copranaerobaculum intestinale]
MTKYQFQVNISEQEHDAFVTVHPLCNLLQSSNWAKIKSSWNHKLVGVRNEQGNLVASSLVLIKPLPLSFTMFYLPRGPILDFLDKELVSFFFTELKKLAESEHCVFIKFDAGILKNSYRLENRTDVTLSSSLTILNNLKASGCIHQGFSKEMSDTIQPRFQAPVFYDRLFEDHLPRHTKRHIRTARKKHVTVQTYGAEMLSAFTRLMKLTEQRKHIALRDQNYFQSLLETYGSQDAKIYLAQDQFTCFAC